MNETKTAYINTPIEPANKTKLMQIAKHKRVSLANVMRGAALDFIISATCTECGSVDIGYHICQRCNNPLCNRCAGVSSICTGCA